MRNLAIAWCIVVFIILCFFSIEKAYPQSYYPAAPVTGREIYQCDYDRTPNCMRDFQAEKFRDMQEELGRLEERVEKLEGAWWGWGSDVWTGGKDDGKNGAMREKENPDCRSRAGIVDCFYDDGSYAWYSSFGTFSTGESGLGGFSSPWFKEHCSKDKDSIYCVFFSSESGLQYVKLRPK